MVVPIRKVIRNQRLLSLLESQFPKDTQLGVEYVEGNLSDDSYAKYRLYVKIGKADWGSERFVIGRLKSSGKIREYTLEGSINFRQ